MAEKKTPPSVTVYPPAPMKRYLVRESARARMTQSKFCLVLMYHGMKAIDARGGVVGDIPPEVLGQTQGRTSSLGPVPPKTPRLIKLPKSRKKT